MLKAPGWEMSIVWYFFLGGIAGGAYFTAAIADNFGSRRDSAVARIGYLLSLPLVALCGLLLIVDLGVPSRFLNMMRVLKPTDPMSIGAWGVGIFGVFGDELAGEALLFAAELRFLQSDDCLIGCHAQHESLRRLRELRAGRRGDEPANLPVHPKTHRHQ